MCCVCVLCVCVCVCVYVCVCVCVCCVCVCVCVCVCCVCVCCVCVCVVCVCVCVCVSLLYYELKVIFFQGVAPPMRKEVWPFLLGLYRFDSTGEQRRELWHMRHKEYWDINTQR